MDRTNCVRLLDLPFLRDDRGLDTRGVVFCCRANVQGSQVSVWFIQFISQCHMVRSELGIRQRGKKYVVSIGAQLANFDAIAQFLDEERKSKTYVALVEPQSEA